MYAVQDAAKSHSNECRKMIFFGTCHPLCLLAGSSPVQKTGIEYDRWINTKIHSDLSKQDDTYSTTFNTEAGNALSPSVFYLTALSSCLPTHRYTHVKGPLLSCCPESTSFARSRLYTRLFTLKYRLYVCGKKSTWPRYRKKCPVAGEKLLNIGDKLV